MIPCKAGSVFLAPVILGTLPVSTGSHMKPDASSPSGFLSFRKSLVRQGYLDAEVKNLFHPLIYYKIYPRLATVCSYHSHHIKTVCTGTWSSDFHINENPELFVR